MDIKFIQLEQQLQQQASLLAKQKKTIQRISMLFTISSFFLTTFFLSSFKPEKDNGIIRAKGIVIIDENGKDRILIGAPFPYSKNRIRTDFEKAKATWSNAYGGNFDWYKTNKSITHGGTGMLILDENGHDRVAIGSPMPTSYIGRIAPGHGITINDEKGGERGGFSWLKNDKIDRMVLGLDHSTGYEGATIGVMEDGSTQIRLNDPNSINRLTIMNDKGQLAKWDKRDQKILGVVFKDSLGKTIQTVEPLTKAN